MVAAMQHTTRCMATPAPSVSCVFGPLNVDAVAWECRTVRFQCLMLARTVVPLKSAAHTQCRRANASHQDHHSHPTGRNEAKVSVSVMRLKHSPARRTARTSFSVIVAMFTTELLLVVVAGGVLLLRHNISTPRSSKLWLCRHRATCTMSGGACAARRFDPRNNLTSRWSRRRCLRS